MVGPLALEVQLPLEVAGGRRCGRTSGRPLVQYYRGLVLEQLGRYDDAAAALADTREADPQLMAEIQRARERLETP